MISKFLTALLTCALILVSAPSYAQSKSSMGVSLTVVSSEQALAAHSFVFSQDVWVSVDQSWVKLSASTPVDLKAGDMVVSSATSASSFQSDCTGMLDLAHKGYFQVGVDGCISPSASTSLANNEAPQEGNAAINQEVIAMTAVALNN